MTRAESKKLAKITGLVLSAHDALVTKHYELPPEKRPPGGSSEVTALYAAFKLLKSMGEK
jgi:hypothetical protein